MSVTVKVKAKKKFKWAIDLENQIKFNEDEVKDIDPELAKVLKKHKYVDFLKSEKSDPKKNTDNKDKDPDAKEENCELMAECEHYEGVPEASPICIYYAEGACTNEEVIAKAEGNDDKVDTTKEDLVTENKVIDPKENKKNKKKAKKAAKKKAK